MDGGSAGFAYVHGWTVVGQRICTGCTVVGQCRSSCRGAIAEEQLSRSSTPVDSTDLFRIIDLIRGILATRVVVNGKKPVRVFAVFDIV